MYNIEVVANTANLVVVGSIAVKPDIPNNDGNNEASIISPIANATIFLAPNLSISGLNGTARRLVK